MREFENLSGTKLPGRKELAERVPFQIRAHHLHHFLKAGQDIEGIKRPGLLSKLLRQQNSITTLVERINRSSFQVIADFDYRGDTFGPTEESAQATKKRFETALSLFYTLPVDYPVIVNSKPDVICASCAIGNHCQNHVVPFPNSDHKSLNLLKSLIDYFETGKHHNSKTNALGYVQEHTEVRTDVGTLRNVFHNMRQDGYWFFY